MCPLCARLASIVHLLWACCASVVVPVVRPLCACRCALRAPVVASFVRLLLCCRAPVVASVVACIVAPVVGCCVHRAPFIHPLLRPLCVRRCARCCVHRCARSYVHRAPVIACRLDPPYLVDSKMDLANINSAAWPHEHEYVNMTTSWDSCPLQAISAHHI